MTMVHLGKQLNLLSRLIMYMQKWDLPPSKPPHVRNLMEVLDSPAGNYVTQAAAPLVSLPPSPPMTTFNFKSDFDDWDAELPNESMPESDIEDTIIDRKEINSSPFLSASNEVLYISPQKGDKVNDQTVLENSPKRGPQDSPQYVQLYSDNERLDSPPHVQTVAPLSPSGAPLHISSQTSENTPIVISDSPASPPDSPPLEALVPPPNPFTPQITNDTQLFPVPQEQKAKIGTSNSTIKTNKTHHTALQRAMSHNKRTYAREYVLWPCKTWQEVKQQDFLYTMNYIIELIMFQNGLCR